MEPRLYLFLHGLFAMHEFGDWIQIVLPRVDGHVQRAGGWLMETAVMPRSELILRGVETGQASLAGANIIHLQGYSLTSRRRAATVLVPRPNAILSLLNAMPIGGQPLAISNDGSHSFPSLATVLVFVYTYRREQDVFLENHPWQPYAVNGSISLHIISTSELPENKQHEVETGTALSTLIRGYPGFNFNRAMQPDWRWTPATHYGALGDLKPSGDHFVVRASNQFAFAQAQLEHYAQRLQRLGLVGRFYQEDRPADTAWTVPGPVGLETSNCVGYRIHP